MVPAHEYFAITCLVPVFICRLVIGVCEGMNYPAQTALIAQWIPKQERGWAWAWVVGGENMGTIIAMFVCPFIAHIFGWQYIFYISGLLGFLWSIIFCIVVSECPQQSRWIDSTEKEHILANVDVGVNSRLPKDVNAQESAMAEAPRPVQDPDGARFSHRDSPNGQTRSSSQFERRDTNIVPTNGAIVSVPWCRFFRNVPFGANVLSHFSFNWSYYLMLSQIPSFFSDRFGVSYEDMAFISVLPYIIAFVTSLFCGQLADKLMKLQRFRDRDSSDEISSDVISGRDWDLTSSTASTQCPDDLAEGTEISRIGRFHGGASFPVQDGHEISRDTASESAGQRMAPLISWNSNSLDVTRPENSQDGNPGHKDAVILKFTGVTAVRKLYALIAQVLQGSTLLLLSFCHDENTAIILVCVGVGVTSLNFAGVFAAYLDMSPGEYGPHLMGVGNSIASLPGLIGNLTVALFGGNFVYVFLLAAVVEIVGLLPFLIWGDCDDQKF